MSMCVIWLAPAPRGIAIDMPTRTETRHHQRIYINVPGVSHLAELQQVVFGVFAVGCIGCCKEGGRYRDRRIVDSGSKSVVYRGQRGSLIVEGSCGGSAEDGSSIRTSVPSQPVGEYFC